MVSTRDWFSSGFCPLHNFKLGRGMLSSRITARFLPPLNTLTDRLKIWHTARRLDFALLDSNPERRLVIRQTDRAHYALGILGLESDYGNVEVNEADD